MLLLLALANSGCSGSFEIGRPAKPAIALPAGSAVLETPQGEVIEEPASIETVITGMRQAQEVRTLTRQLAR
jgi:hypothetical protein